MQLLLNATIFVVCDFKNRPNDNLITVACVFALVLLYPLKNSQAVKKECGLIIIYYYYYCFSVHTHKKVLKATDKCCQ